ncbi:MAG: SPFH domain-containing protein [Protaetiibacter sp.]
MASIRVFPFAHHLRSTPSMYVIHSKRGEVRHAGAGAAFFFRPLGAAISEVPIAESELSLVFAARTSDFQQATVQATVTYRFREPEVAASRIDFSIDPYHGGWIGSPLAQVGSRITELAQQYATEHISAVPLVELLRSGTPTVRSVTASGLAEDARLAETSVEVIAVRIVSIRPDADTERALEAPVREQVQQAADAAGYERRALAVERERAIAENELQNKIELATREQQLVQQEGANAQRRATEEAATQLIAARASAERERVTATAHADTVRLAGEASAAAEAARLAANAGVPPEVLRAIALRELAQHMPPLSSLTVTPEILAALLAGNGGAAGPTPTATGEG